VDHRHAAQHEIENLRGEQREHESRHRADDHDRYEPRPEVAHQLRRSAARACTGEEVNDADVDAESSRCFDDDEERRRREDDACVVPRE